jgi:monoterpene epsilon-lactone hydrolase
MSWQMTAVAALMRATRKRRLTDPAGGRAMLERAKGDATPPRWLSRRCAVAAREVAGFTVVSVAPHGTAGDGPVVVHLHGGAYVNEAAKQHWQLAQAYAEGLGVEVLMPLYGLAPRHHALEALAFTTALLEELADAGRAAYLSGDSAGGGLALLTAQHSSPSARACVRGMALLAPWVDLTMSNPDIPAVERRDPWLARAALHEVARAWAADVPVDDLRASPLGGELAGLPPVDLWVGERDITLPDTRLLRDRLREAGVEVRYVEEPGALHVYPILPVPEGRAARRDLVARAGATLGVG